MIKLDDSAFVVFGIGKEVKYKKEWYSIANIGYRSIDGSFVSFEAGKLMYMLVDAEGLSFGWVLADEVSTDEEIIVEDTRTQELMDIGQNMISWAIDLPEREDSSRIPEIVTLLMAIQYDKEGSYGSSWRGKGEYRGIMANIDRKYDRLDKMTDDELNSRTKTLAQLEKDIAKLHESSQATNLSESQIMNAIGESKVDAIADLANYSILYLTYVKENFPKVFGIWVNRNVPQYLSKKIPFLLK